MPDNHKLMRKYTPDGFLFSLRKDAIDPRDKVFSTKLKSAVDLPEVVNFRTLAGRVENQGMLSSCTGNAIVNAYELLESKTLSDNKLATDLSRLFVYYNERALENTITQDEGATLRSGIKTLRVNGVCPEKVWPYEEHLWDDKPNTEAFTQAKWRTIETYERLTSLQAMLECLAQGQPFVFGIPIYGDAEPSPGNNWTFERSGTQLLGYHALCCVGYDRRTSLFLVKNSWGTDWGDAGFCYITFGFMAQEALDIWTFSIKLDIPAPAPAPAPVQPKKVPWYRRWFRDWWWDR